MLNACENGKDVFILVRAGGGGANRSKIILFKLQEVSDNLIPSSEITIRSIMQYVLYVYFVKNIGVCLCFGKFSLKSK